MGGYARITTRSLLSPPLPQKRRRRSRRLLISFLSAAARSRKPPGGEQPARRHPRRPNPHLPRAHRPLLAPPPLLSPILLPHPIPCSALAPPPFELSRCCRERRLHSPRPSPHPRRRHTVRASCGVSSPCWVGRPVPRGSGWTRSLATCRGRGTAGSAPGGPGHVAAARAAERRPHRRVRGELRWPGLVMSR